MSTVAVVTGVSTGIGHATAEALLRQGWRVIGVSRDEQRLRLAHERLRRVADEAGGTIVPIRADLTRQIEVRALVASLSTEPRIDVLIHGAGALFGQRRVTDEGHEPGGGRVSPSTPCFLATCTPTRRATRAR